MSETRQPSSRRDLLLQQMGIGQWRLARPEVLQGAVHIAVPPQVRLIIVSEQSIAQQPIVADVLRSLALSAEHSLNVTFDQVPYLQMPNNASVWLLHKNAEKIDRTLAALPPALNVWRSLDLNEFKADPQAKRRFWQTIQQSPAVSADE